MIDAVLHQLSGSRRPLIISDIDEVVLEFLDPFSDYLETESHRLHPHSFRLTGNILSTVDQMPASAEMVDGFQERFFADQHLWQRPAHGAGSSLERLAQHADIVFLTAMPPRHHAIRRQLLDSHALHFPMIATEDAKGPVVQRLIGDRGVPSVFIDDIFYNLQSVRTHAPNCLLLNLMANATFRALAPEPGEGVVKVADWTEAEARILGHFGIATGLGAGRG